MAFSSAFFGLGFAFAECAVALGFCLGESDLAQAPRHENTPAKTRARIKMDFIKWEVAKERVKGIELS